MKNGIPNNLNNGIGIDPVSVDPTPAQPEPTPEVAPDPIEIEPAPVATPEDPTTETPDVQSEATPSAEPVADAKEPAKEQAPVIPDLSTELPVSEVPASETETTNAPQPIPGTAPAATNPTVANSNGFVEPSKVENIGTQPPQEEKKQKPINKILFVILILALMAGVAYGVYYYLRLGNNIKVNPKTVTVAMNEPLSSNVSDYATVKGTAAKNCSVITNEVDNTKIGSYKYTIKCGNKEYTGTIKIVEPKIEPNSNSDLTVTLKDVKVTVGESVTVDEFIVADSCNKENCQFAFTNETGVTGNLQSPGTYTVAIDASADDTESTTIYANLIVLSSEYKLFAVCAKTDNNAEITDRIAFNTVNEFNDTAYRIYKYTFDTENDYNAVASNKLSRITYNDITGNASYNDEEKTVSIFVNLDKATLTSEYGSEFPSAYNEITSYYKDKGYTCILEK